jgi:hypothetical protein
VYEDGMPGASTMKAARPLLAGFFLLALMLRAMVPAGFMVGNAATGGPALILCPGFEPPPPVHAMAMRGHVPAHRHDPATHREAPCPFAALAAPAVPPSPPLIAAPAALPHAPAGQLLLRAASPPRLAAPPPPATGPPIQA